MFEIKRQKEKRGGGKNERSKRKRSVNGKSDFHERHSQQGFYVRTIALSVKARSMKNTVRKVGSHLPQKRLIAVCVLNGKEEIHQHFFNEYEGRKHVKESVVLLLIHG